MLDKLFLQILNMSFTGAIIIILVLLVRLLLKKAPKVFSYGLWSVVLFRLICPFSIESIFSILPTNTAPISEDIFYMDFGYGCYACIQPFHLINVERQSRKCKTLQG